MKKSVKIGLIILVIAIIAIPLSLFATKSAKKAHKAKLKAQEAASTKSISVNLAETAQLEKAGASGKIKYTIKDENIVSVSSTGILSGLKAGKTTVVADNGQEKTTYKVAVAKHGMAYPAFTMMQSEQLPMAFNNKEKATSWASSDKSIASVTNKGIVSANKAGSCIITGTTAKRTYQCQLTVTKKIDKIIYLTFDDGPSRTSTPKILDILKKNNVKATFFELRPAGTDFDLTKRVIDEGHTLALHGFKHKYDQIYKSEKIYKSNLDRLQKMFFNKFGVWCTISRFPGGSSNTCSSYNKGIMTRLSKLVDTWGYHYFDWNVSSGDAGGPISAKQEYKNVTHGLWKSSPNVVLMHDFPNNHGTINALDKIIKYAKKNGYTFRPLTASTAEVHHHINN